MGGTDAKTLVLSLVLNVVNILVLYLILRSLVYKPVKKFMAARAGKITAQFDDASKKLQEANDLRDRYNAELASIAEAADTQRRKAINEADKRAQQILDEANEEAKQIKESAAIRAEHDANRLMEDMREKIADIAIDIAGKVVEREVSKNDNADIIEKYFDRVGLH